MLLVHALLLVPWARAGACAPDTAARIADEVKRVEDAYLTRDAEGVRAGGRALLGAVPCLDAVLDPELAAHIHLGVGLWGWSERTGNPVVPAREAFAAARTAYPDTLLGARVALETPPEQREYTAIATSDGTFRDAPKVDGFSLYLDGALAQQQPLDWPTIAQWVDAKGEVVLSAFVRTGASLPSPGGERGKRVVEAPRPVPAEPTDAAPRRATPRPDAAATGALGVAPPFATLVEAARNAVLEGRYADAARSLDAATAHAPTASALLLPADLASIPFLRGAVAWREGDPDEAFEHWRVAHATWPDFAPDPAVLPDPSAQDAYYALSGEIEGGEQIPVGPVGDELPVYVDGLARAEGDTVPAGRRFVQVRCADGHLAGQWYDFGAAPDAYAALCEGDSLRSSAAATGAAGTTVAVSFTLLFAPTDWVVEAGTTVWGPDRPAERRMRPGSHTFRYYSAKRDVAMSCTVVLPETPKVRLVFDWTRPRCPSAG